MKLLSLALILTSSLVSCTSHAQDSIIDSATVVSVMGGGVTSFILKQPMTLPGGASFVSFFDDSKDTCYVNLVSTETEIRQLNCGPVRNCPPRVLHVAPKTVSTAYVRGRMQIVMPVVGDPTVSSIECFLTYSSAGHLRQAVSNYFSVQFPPVTQAELELPEASEAESSGTAFGI